MPTDANGVHSLPDGYLAVTGETIQASQHNPPLEDLSTAVTQRVMRSGVTPMTGPLKLADGSASAPGIAFNTASNFGLFKTADGIGVSISGTQVAEFTANGLETGSRLVGEMIIYTGRTAPTLWLLPYGQNVNRADYPRLWVFAQAEIAAGTEVFTNGDGVSTFGIPDMRGRVPAGASNIGGVDAGNLPSGGAFGRALGAATVTLTTTEMPAHAHAGTTSIEDATHTHPMASYATLSGSTGTVSGGGGNFASTAAGSTGAQNVNHRHTFTSDSQGSGGPHTNLQPSRTCNFLLYAGD